MRINKSERVKAQNLIPIKSMDRLFELADTKKSIWWTSRKMLWSAAFFQNWNARQLQNWINNRWIMEVKSDSKI